MNLQIRFDRGPQGRSAQFRAARRVIVAETIADIPAAFQDLDAARQDGFWVAGYVSYEAGFALEPRLTPRMPTARRVPLICFGVFDAPVDADPLAAGPCGLGPFVPRWDDARYGQAFSQLHDLIGAGDIYQANLTFPLDATCTGGAEAIYAALAARQPVGHGALVQQDGLPSLLSRSPELFFRTEAQ